MTILYLDGYLLLLFLSLIVFWLPFIDHHRLRLNNIILVFRLLIVLCFAAVRNLLLLFLATIRLALSRLFLTELSYLWLFLLLLTARRFLLLLTARRFFFLLSASRLFFLGTRLLLLLLTARGFLIFLTVGRSLLFYPVG